MPNKVYGLRFTVHSLKPKRFSLIESVNCQLSSIRRAQDDPENIEGSTVNCSKAFTLIELLVVMGILGFILSSTAMFLSNVLKGSNQANIVSEVKQNGQVVLDTIDRQIRNATFARQIIPGLDPNPIPGSSSVIQLGLPTGAYIFLACFNQTPGVSNGWVGIGRANNKDDIPANFISLTNKDTISGVDVVCDSSGTFLVSGDAIDPYPQVVQVGFKVNQGVFAVSRADFMANAEFKTTISLRKY